MQMKFPTSTVSITKYREQNIAAPLDTRCGKDEEEKFVSQLSLLTLQERKQKKN